MQFSSNRQAVFLDRDGVINRSIVIDGKPYPPANVKDLEILPYVAEALVLLEQAGFLLVVVTNQPDAALGITSRDTIEEINNYLLNCLPIHDIYTCFHTDANACNCRKPAPGALFAAAEKYNISLQKSYMVGDRWKDIEAGQRAGCQTIFINYGYCEPQPALVSCKVENLMEAAQFILGEERDRARASKN